MFIKFIQDNANRAEARDKVVAALTPNVGGSKPGGVAATLAATKQKFKVIDFQRIILFAIKKST